MQTIAPFGIITACHAGDYFLAKATCASIRHYMPEIPVCVIVDGDFSIKELQDSYGVLALRVCDFEDPRLRKLCAGSPRSKLAAIWESPFSNFVCFDSDIIVWGDISKCINLINNDFVMLTNLVSSPKDKANIEQFFYSPDRISELNADFQWLDRPFFCAGAFAAKRGVFSVDEYIALEEFSARTPGVFNFAEQGIFNYLVQTYSDHGKIRLGIADLQYIVVDHSRQDAIARFGQLLSVPPLTSIGNPTLIHFCGQKPLLQNLKAYNAPFTAFRLLHLVKKYKNFTCPRAWAWLKILCEELHFLTFRLERKVRGFLPSENLLASGMFSSHACDDQVEVVNKLGKLPGLLNSKKNQSNTEIVAKFGIVTACHAKDYFMAKATCASIRYYMPDVPICVVVDGDFDIRELEKTYGVLVMRVDQVKNPKLREMCSRSTRSKLAAQWEGPFERYLWVDCDTVVLGDFVHAEPWQKADFWAMTAIRPGTVPDHNLRHYFLNPDELQKIDPEFHPHHHPLFCDGAYVARRGCLDLERTYQMWKKSIEHSNLFSWTKSQGLTNYMVFSSQQRGELKVSISNRQYIVPDHPRMEVVQEFGGGVDLPPKQALQANVVHFCGIKPLIQNWKAYHSLFTAFRLLHYRNVYGAGFFGRLRSWLKILCEEIQIIKPRFSRKLGIK